MVDLAFPLSAPVDVRAAAAEAEAAGYSAVWTSEVKHDPFTALAVAAVTTERVELGTAIALAFARNPMSLAVQANDVHDLSKGRLLLGLGSQIKPHIERRFNMTWSHPAPRMREYVEALKAIWYCWESGEKLNFRGDFYQHTLMTPFFDPGPNPYGRPRVLLAGVGDGMTSVAGEVADGFLCHGFTTERYLREVTLPALEEGRAKSGATLVGYEIAGVPFVATGANDEELATACAGVRGQIAFYGSTPAYRAVLKLHGWGGLADELHRLSIEGRWAEMGPLVTDDVLAAFAVIGKPAEVGAELIRRYGDLMTRMTFYTPYEIEPRVLAQIAMDVRAAQ